MFCLRRTGKESRKLFSGKNGELYGKSGPLGLLLTTERSAGKPSAFREWQRCTEVYNSPLNSTRLGTRTAKDGVHQHIGLEGTRQTGEENAIWHSWTRRDSPNVRHRQWRHQVSRNLRGKQALANVLVFKSRCVVAMAGINRVSLLFH